VNREPLAGSAPTSGGARPPEEERTPVVRTLSASTPPLAGRTGAGVSIAVIDSGINPGHPHLGPIAGGVGLTPDGEETTGFVDRLGHGTAVTAAIQEKAPGAEVHIVRVFGDELATSVATLVRAIDWATGRRVHLINLSLGTPNEARRSALEAALERAARVGTFLVSASEHDDARWLPGALPGAIGVRLDWECPREAVRIRTGGRAVCAASGYARPIPGVLPERNLKGISFAVANATGLIALALEGAGRPRSVDELWALVRRAAPG